MTHSEQQPANERSSDRPEEWTFVVLSALGGAVVGSLALVGRMPISWLVATLFATAICAKAAGRGAHSVRRVLLAAVPLASLLGGPMLGLVEEGADAFSGAEIAHEALVRPWSFFRELMAACGPPMVATAGVLATLILMPLLSFRTLEPRLKVRSAAWLNFLVVFTSLLRERCPSVGRGGLSEWFNVVALAVAAAVIARAFRRSLSRGARWLVLLAGGGAGVSLFQGFTLIQRSRPLTDIGAVAVVAPGTICALRKAGTIVCWGRGDDGSLGHAGLAWSTKPVEIPGVDDAVQIDDGQPCALRRDGALYCWGRDGSEQNVGAASLPPARAVGAGCALLAANRDIFCWAPKEAGSPGRWVFVATAPGATRILRTAFGGCARASDQVRCWGRSNGAPSTVGKMPPCMPPWTRPGGPPPPEEARLGAGASLFELESQGLVRYWEPFPPRNSATCGEPVEVKLGLTRARRVAVVSVAMKRDTDLGACALDDDGEIACRDLGGRARVEISGAIDLAADSEGRFCAVRKDGTVWCWGGPNRHGEIGDGTNREADAPRAVIRG